MMASSQVVETSVNTNNSPSQDYTTNPNDHSNHNRESIIAYILSFICHVERQFIYCKPFLNLL